jgi:CHAD domain-containing protein/uncharacterized protein YjbK
MLEIEAKYEIPSEKIFRSLLKRERVGEFVLCVPRQGRVTDIYYDTPDGALRNLGYGCRVRSQSGKILLTLKHPGRVEGAVQMREELERPLPKGKTLPADWPANSITAVLKDLVQIDRLVEVCRIQQTRHKSSVRMGRRSPLEWSLDRVVAVTFSGEKRRFLELEIEIRPSGKPEDLRLFLDHFDSSGLTPLATNKLERILSAPTTASKPSKEKTKASRAVCLDDPIRVAAAKILDRQFRQVLARKKGTIQGEDIEELYRMRTSIRRLRAALNLFEAFLPGKERSKGEKSSRKLGRALGHVRDLDVILGRLDRYREHHPEEFAEFDALHLLREKIEDRRKSERKKMVAFLEGPGYKKFQKALKNLLSQSREENLAGDKHLPEPRVRDVFPALLWEAYGRIVRFETVMANPDLVSLHELRIECKRMRYLLEFFQKCFGPVARTVRSRIKRAQEELGEIQDSKVTHDLLEEFREDLNSPSLAEEERSPALQAIHLYEDRITQNQTKHLERIPALWKELVGRELWKEIGQLVDGTR